MSQPPRPERRPVERLLHGDRCVDPYAWLRDREDPAVIEHLEAENAYTGSALAHLADLRKALYAEMLGRVQETDTSAPVLHGPYRYYTRTEEGRPFRVHCRAPRDGGSETVLLDENERAEGKTSYRLGSIRVSPDHSMLAFTEDAAGAERYALHVLKLSDGSDAITPIEGLKVALAWIDDATLLFTVPDAMDRPYRAMRLRLGAEPELLYEEKDDRFFLGVARTLDGERVVVQVASKTSAELWYLDTADPLGPLQLLAERRPGVLYDATHHPSGWFVQLNDTGVNFRLVRATEGQAPSAWEEVLPHDEAVYLTGVQAFADHVALFVRREGQARVRILDLGSGEVHEIAEPEAACTATAGILREFRTSVLRYGVSSQVTPNCDVDYDMATRERTVVKQRPIRGGHDSTRYVTTRLEAKAPDGTTVPVAVAHRRDLVLDGTNPALLYGYGSYGICYDPEFSINALSLLERGMVVAIGQIRGGGDMGRAWYEAGKLQHKQNTFDDFAACCSALAAKGYTSPDRLVIWGGSAGGLLMGAMVNQHREVFGAVVARVPFVDVTNTMLDDSLPLTVTEYEEWGNPNEPEAYATIRAYSPYDNVVTGAKPAILATGGLNDPRVGFWEPAKWVARLRDCQTNDTPILLHMHLGAGHGGPTGRYAYLEDLALIYAFVLDAAGAGHS